jgi:hypothetical protein
MLLEIGTAAGFRYEWLTRTRGMRRELKSVLAAKSQGGKSSSQLTDEQWAKVIGERDSRARKNRQSKNVVSKQIHDELVRGVFPGIAEKKEISADTIRRKRPGQR